MKYFFDELVQLNAIIRIWIRSGQNSVSHFLFVFDLWKYLAISVNWDAAVRRWSLKWCSYKFLKFHKKNLVSDFNLTKMAGWKIFQNSQENTCGSALFLTKMQFKKIFKVHEKTPASSLVFNKVAG